MVVWIGEELMLEDTEVQMTCVLTSLLLLYRSIACWLLPLSPPPARSRASPKKDGAWLGDNGLQRRGNGLYRPLAAAHRIQGCDARFDFWREGGKSSCLLAVGV